MQEVRRVTTVKKPKKITTILLVVVGILGLILISVAVYFYITSKDKKTQQPKKEILCGCYYLDTQNGARECTDPRRGFMFQTAKITEGETCKTSCPLSSLSLNQLNSKTEQNKYKSCQLPTISNASCSEMVVKDREGKIVTGTISSNEELTIEAKFDNPSYSKQKFIINSEPVEPDTVSEDKKTITKKISKFESTSLSINATAVAPNGDKIDSITCRRLINVQKDTESTVSNLVITTATESGKFQIAGMTMVIGNLPETDQLSIDFSFDSKEAKPMKMSKGFTVNPSKGELSILGTELYNESNFSEKITFSQFNEYEGDLSVTAKITNTTKKTEVGTVSQTVKFPTKEDITDKPQQTDKEESNFKVSKKSNIQCVERVAPNNQVEYTIIVTNAGSSSQKINTIKDKLPLGFIYNENSSKINGIVATDQELVKQTTVGDSKEIVWSTKEGWTLGSSESITIVFNATAGANAITGSNQNEVVIAPAQIPSDPTQLRAESVINVAQDCTNQSTTQTPITPPTQQTPQKQPQTGILDTAVGRLILGIIVMIIGWYIYNKPLGQTVVKKLLTSQVYKGMEMTSLRVFKPKKYFEEKAISNLSRKKK